MRFFRGFLMGREQKKLQEPVFREMLGMHQEVRQAHAEWQVAHQKLNWAMEKDQIDYAIYALEAAEKRYIMLLRQAKQLDWADGLLIASQAQRLHSEAKEKEQVKGNELSY